MSQATKSAEDYLVELNLESDQLEEVKDEMKTAAAAWKDTMGDEQSCLLSTRDTLLSELVIKLGTTYDEESHGVELREISSAAGGYLTRDAFIDWYVHWIFKSEGDEFSDNGNESDDNMKGSGGESAAKKNWSATSWSVAPASVEEAGVTWKCKSCRIINQWSAARCLACDSPAPHAADLETSTGAAASTSSGFSFGGASSSAPPSTFSGAAITSSGFTFGGVPSASAGAAGFSTANTSSVNPTTTSGVSVFSFGAPTSAGSAGATFTFGNVTVPATQAAAAAPNNH